MFKSVWIDTMTSKDETIAKLRSYVKELEDKTGKEPLPEIEIEKVESDITERKSMKMNVGNPENAFEMDLSPKSIGDIRSQELELEHEKLGLAKLYLSLDVDQKTEIEISERTILSALQLIAHTPYSISSKKYPKLMKMNDMKSHVLITYIQNYFRLGIPMKRRGREEESKILTGVFNSTQVEAMPSQANQNNRLIQG